MVAAGSGCVCGSLNPLGQRFCGSCGTRLAQPCPSCGNLQPGDNRFCEDCGTNLPGWCPACKNDVSRGKPYCGACGTRLSTFPVENSVAPAETLELPSEEHRLVTALFCDLVGFTPLTERLDTEGIRNLQADYFERMSAVIARFGGKVEKFAGDAVLALFGIPITEGDDAERAVLCALAMHDAMQGLAIDALQRWNAQLALRIGINTGEAVGGLREAGGRADYAVTGDVLNTAARLQATTEPGTVMVGEETMRLTRKVIRYDERRELALKGKSRPVAAYQVIGRRGELSPQPDSGTRALIGRGRELAALSQALARSRAGEGQLLTIVGDAGMGKTRLVGELLRGLPVGTRVVRARALSHSKDISLSAIADLVRSVGSIDEGADPEMSRRTLFEVVGPLISDQAVLPAVMDVLNDVTGLDDAQAADAQARRQALIRSLRLVLTGLSRQGPAVVILEDLQWVDAASADVLAAVLSDLPSLRLCVLATHRAGWTPPWTEWPWVERINLRPLRDDKTGLLARQLLGDIDLSPDLNGYLFERSGGNPFFIEELVHALLENGGIVPRDGHMCLVAAAAHRLPSTLTEILLARLDALSRDARALAQAAGVLGREFDIDILEAVLETPALDQTPALDELLRAEIAVRKPAGRGEFAFKNAALRDVAYHTLLSPRRKQLHHAAGLALLALRHSDDTAEIVAFHLSQTDDHARAAEWLERAGDRAAAAWANNTAVERFEEARRRLTLIDAQPAALARLAEKLGSVFRVVGWYDESLEEMESAAAGYRNAGDPVAEARAVAQVGEIHTLRGAPQEAVDRIREVLARLDREDGEETIGACRLYNALVEPMYALDRMEDALTAAWRAVELARSGGDGHLLMEATTRHGLALLGTGLLGEAEEVLNQAVHGATAADSSVTYAYVLSLLGEISLAKGHPQSAQEFLQFALRIEQDHGDLGRIATIEERLGQIAYILGDWVEARERLERAVDLVRTISFAHFSPAILMALGEQYLREGADDRAARYFEEPLTLAERSGQTALLPRLQIPLAARDLRDGRPERALERLAPLLDRPPFESAADYRAMQIVAASYIQLGCDDKAETLIDRGLAFAEEQGHRLAVLGWLETKGELAVHRGQTSDAAALFNAALTVTRDIPFPYTEARLLLRLGTLLGSIAQINEAGKIFQGLGAARDLTRTEMLAEAARGAAATT